MDEYLAHPCADGGGLLEALSRDEVDDGLLAAAGELLGALIAGGPAADIDDYADGAAAVASYLSHLESRAASLRDFLTVDAIRRFLENDEADWQDRAGRGWSPAVREALRSECSALLDRPEWRGRVGTESGTADEVASRSRPGRRDARA